MPIVKLSKFWWEFYRVLAGDLLGSELLWLQPGALGFGFRAWSCNGKEETLQGEATPRVTCIVSEFILMVSYIDILIRTCAQTQ